MSLKSLLKNRCESVKVSLCSLKKKIGDPARTNISRIMTH